jgi:hypothetical protein
MSKSSLPPGVALAALTLMIGTTATASAHAERPELTGLQRKQLDLISSPTNAIDSAPSTQPQRLARQQDIHHHNWLGGDNDVVTKARNITILAKASDPNDLVFRV